MYLKYKIQNTLKKCGKLQNTKYICISNTYFKYMYFKYCPALIVDEILVTLYFVLQHHNTLTTVHISNTEQKCSGSVLLNVS